MSNVTQIKTMRPVNRAIYAYTTPNDRTHDGWIKIENGDVYYLVNVCWLDTKFHFYHVNPKNNLNYI